MATWADMVKEFTAASRGMLAQELWRSSINRAYYAVYSAVTHCLQFANVHMPLGWEGPHHEKVYNGTLIAFHLSPWLSASEIGRLIDRVNRLYHLRRLSDYCPSELIGRQDARQALALLLESIPILEKVR